MIEREFGEKQAQNYEEYVSQSNSLRNVQVEQLDPKIEFNASVDHMNQVIAYERLLYFGYIFESSGMLQQSKSEK